MKNRLLAILAIGAIAGAVHATSAVSFTPGANFTNGQWSLGWAFTANANITVTHLGFYDDLGNGLSESHDVGIYSETGTLLMWATVTPAAPLSSSFWRYTSSIAGATSLVAGQNYVIAASTGSERYTFEVTDFVTAPEIAFLGNRFIESGVLAFPDQHASIGDPGYFGPNFQFGPRVGVVPGPVAGLAFGLGLLGQARRRRRR